MGWWIYALIGVLCLAILACVPVKQRLKRRLESIDGMAGVVRQNGEEGKVIARLAGGK